MGFFDFFRRDKDGESGLMKAVRKGHTKAVQILLDKGADINAIDDSGHTALMFSVAEGHNDIVKVLLDRGAHINAKNNYNQTPLHLASSSNHFSTVKVLLNNKSVNITCKDKDGRTALVLAEKARNYEVVELLRKTEIALNKSGAKK